ALRVTHQRAYEKICFGAVCGDSVNHEMFLFTDPDGRILCAKDEGLPADGAWEHAATIANAWWFLWSHPAGGVGVECEGKSQRVARGSDGSWALLSSEVPRSIQVRLDTLSAAGPVAAYLDEPGDLSLEDGGGSIIPLGWGECGLRTYGLPAGTKLD